jgi:hypothetical protein
MSEPSQWMDTLEKSQDDARQEERERIIELLLKIRTCTPTKGLCENCQQTEFCIDQIREEQERWEALGEITGSENQRNRILNIVENGDWSGENLAQDRANLRQLILGFPL